MSEAHFIGLSLSKPEMQDCFQKIFTEPEAFAVVSALINAILTLKQGADQKDPYVVSLVQYTVASLSKILAALPEELEKQALEGMNSVGFNFELREVFVNQAPEGAHLN